MSINIKTATGLLEIGGNITKEKIVSALGYSPADEKIEENINNHINASNIHITSEERTVWNNKSEFSGSYIDLDGRPNIEEDESDNVVIADNNGNVIMKVDSEGVNTVNVNTKTVNLNGQDLGSRLDSLESISLPNIEDNENGDLIIADGLGNAIAKFDSNGLETTTVTSKAVVVNGADVESKFGQIDLDIDGVSDNLSTHKSDNIAHITDVERTAWNNKSEFSGDFNDLANKPNINDDGSGEVVYADNSGNIVAKISSNGLETTTVTAKAVVVNGTDVESKLNDNNSNINTVSGNLSTHKSDTNIHISASERQAWTESIAQNKTNIENHTTDNVAHITAAERTVWNNKSDFTGDYKDLSNAPNITEDETGEVVYTDGSGNIIARINSEGLKTTQVIADTSVVGGVNVGEKMVDLDTRISNHSSNTTVHITASERTSWNAKATTEYVDNAIAGIVNSAPDKLNTLDELAAALGDDANFANTVTNSLAEKATKSELNNMKTELSENIVSDSKEWTVVDNSGNIIAKVDSNGLDTTNVTAKTMVVNGTDVKTALDGKSNTGHKHTKSEITDFPTSLKNPNALTIQGNGTTLTNGTYDGSAAKTVNITPASIGAAASSHGNHVPTTETANNAKFLRNDNTWQTVSPTNIGAMDLTSAQTASGVKTFSNGIKIGSASLTYDSTNKRLVISFS